MTFSLPSPLPSPSLLLKLPVLSKATVKQPAKTCNMFCNINTKQGEQQCCAFFAHVQTSLATNQVVVSCVNSNFFLHGSYVTFAKTFALDWQSAQHLLILLQKVELYCPLSATIIHNLQQPDLLQDKFELEFDSFCSSVWKQQAARFFFSVKINRLSDCVSFIKVKTLSRGTILSILFSCTVMWTINWWS